MPFKILVVDDKELALSTAKMVLGQDPEFEVQTATGAAEAIDLIKAGARWGVAAFIFIAVSQVVGYLGVPSFFGSETFLITFHVLTLALFTFYVLEIERQRVQGGAGGSFGSFEVNASMLWTNSFSSSMKRKTESKIEDPKRRKM